MFLFLLGRCEDAEFGDEFMFNLWENCQTVFQGILHSSLSVWRFCFPTALLTLGILFWFHFTVGMRWAGMWASSPPFFSKHIFLLKVSLFSDDMLSLLPFTLGLSGHISDPVFSSKISRVQISLICICSSFSLSWSLFLLPLGGVLRAHFTVNAKPNLFPWIQQ